MVDAPPSTIKKELEYTPPAKAESWSFRFLFAVLVLVLVLAGSIAGIVCGTTDQCVAGQRMKEDVIVFSFEQLQ